MTINEVRSRANKRQTTLKGRGQGASCSFCRKTYREVGTLVEAPGAIFVCGPCVKLCQSILDQERRERRGADFADSDTPTPRALKEELDRHVIGQDRAKRALAVAVHNHYKRLALKSHGASGVEIDKSNVLLIGPTGSGKTLLVKTLARLLDVPFAIGDATVLTEAGYVGEDVESLLLKLLHAAHHDVQAAQRGIIFIDEIDKIARTQHNVSITRDVSGEGVQQSLLKILEGTVSNVPPQGGRKHPEQQCIPIDTSNILFICGGTFTGLEQIIGRRLGRGSIGFGKISSQGQRADEHLFREVTPEDLVAFGMIPEFVGRLPVIAPLDPLDEAALINILTEPCNAIIRQYKELFAMEGAELQFEPGALSAIARRARARDTGARGLRNVVEELMTEVMFQLPDGAREEKYTITADLSCIRQSEQLAV